MDQINIYYAHAPNKNTINVCGTKTINMHVGADNSKRCTVVFTITASSQIIKPMVLSAGIRGGCIGNKSPIVLKVCTTLYKRRYGLIRSSCSIGWRMFSRPTLPRTPLVSSQSYYSIYLVCILGSVADAILCLGVEIEFIPTGCTSFM